MTKKRALAKYLQIKKADITEDGRGSASDCGIFEVGNQQYLVLTDDEADEKAKEYILDTVWAFNVNFIIEHSSALDFDEASEEVVQAISEQYEAGNEAMKKLIDDLDEFVDDAISADGRGHFLSTYDRNEGKEGEYFIYRTN